MTARKLSLSLGLVLACVLSLPIASAQQPPSNAELKKDIEGLKESLKVIQKDLQDIKVLLQSRPQISPPPQNVILDLGSQPFKGERTAKLTLVEFVDYQ